MRKTLALLALIAAGVSLCPALDFSFGGNLEASYAYAYDSTSYGDHASMRATPLATLTGQSWEACVSASFAGATDPSDATIDLEEARIRAWIGDYVSLAAGWSQEDGTAAEVFPQTAFFGPSDSLSRLESAGASARRKSEAAVELKVAYSWWRASFSCAPFEPELVLPNLASPWFPDNLVASSFVIGSSTTYTRSSLAYAEGVESPYALSWAPSYIAKAGASLGPLELDLECFHGLERQAVLTGDMSLDYLSYAVSLVPHRATVTSLAIAATAVMGSWRLWTEDAYTWGASLATGSADSGSWPLREGHYFTLTAGSHFDTTVPPCVQRDKVACTAGASWSPDLGSIGLVAFIEGTWCHYLAAPDLATNPSLSYAVAASVSLSRIVGILSFDVSGIISLADNSFALRPAIGLDLGRDMSLELAMPLFFGDSDSELGCYSTKRFAVLTFMQKL
jgi:hypothetical protein